MHAHSSGRSLDSTISALSSRPFLPSPDSARHPPLLVPPRPDSNIDLIMPESLRGDGIYQPCVYFESDA